MLADAYMRGGQWERYVNELAQFDDWEPDFAKPETLVFVARARLWLDPDGAVELLDQASSSRRSAICYLVRAEAHAFRSLNANNPQLVGEALNDAQAAILYLTKESPIANATQLYVRLAAASLHGKSGQHMEAETYRQNAKENVDRLKQDYFLGSFWKAHFHILRGENTVAMNVFDQQLRRGSLGYGAHALTAAAYKADKLDVALEKLSSLPRPRELPVEGCITGLLVLVTDEDQGQSAQSAEGRDGFQHLLVEVALTIVQSTLLNGPLEVMTTLR